MIFCHRVGREITLPKSHRDLILKVGPEVNRRLNLTEDLLDDIQREAVILDRHRQCIDAIGEPYKKKLKLLEVLPRRSDRAFERFLDKLIAHGNHSAASILRTGENIVKFLKFNTILN